MKKVALRKNRFEKSEFKETEWTKKSKNLGEYVFRRISLDQSDKSLQKVRPRHILSKLIIGSGEIQNYVCDYLAMVEQQTAGSANYLDMDNAPKDFKNLQKSIVVPLS